MTAPPYQLAVVPILVGPLQVFLAMLPAILFGVGSALVALFKPKTFRLALRLLWRMKLSILLALAALIGTIYTARAVWRSTAGAVGQAETGAHVWPAFRGGAARTGVSPGSASPLEGGVNWAFASEAKTFHSSPAVVGNRVYVTSAEVGVFSNRGAVYCLDADTGGVVWKSAPEGFRATFSSPSVAGKYLVTGEGLHQVKDGRVTCLDVTRGGAVLWSFRTRSHVESTAAIADGRAIIGAGDDGYYCFRMEPDAEGKPVLLWHLPGDKYPDAETDPLIHEGRAYLGLGIDGHAVVCVEIASGKELWRVATSAPVFSPPAIARGKLFVGMGHGNFVDTEQQVIAGHLDDLRAAGRSDTEIEAARARMAPGGETWCIDLATHQVEWKFQADSTVLGAIVAGEDRLFFASRAGTVYTLGFDGKPLATWNAHSPILASLAVTATHAFAVTESGQFFTLDHALQPVRETRLGNASPCLSSPAIARGHVYVGTPEDGFLCVGQAAGHAAELIWAGELGGAGMGGNPGQTPLATEAELGWSWGGPGPSPGLSLPRMDAVSGPAATTNNRLFVPVDRFDSLQNALADPPPPARHGIVCFRTNGGKKEIPEEQWFAPAANPVSSSPAASKTAVFYSDGRPGSSGRRLSCLSAASGKAMWSANVEDFAFGLGCLTPHAVIAEDQIGSLTSFALNGKVRWREPLGPKQTHGEDVQLAGAPAVEDSRIIVATITHANEFKSNEGAGGWLLVLDEVDGRTLCRFPIAEVPTTGPVIRGKSILVGSSAGISAFGLVDGKRQWRAAVGPVKSALVLCGSYVAATTSRGNSWSSMQRRAKFTRNRATSFQESRLCPPAMR